MSQTTLTSPPVFLTAAWRWLLVLNYEVDRQWLEPWLPEGTELDLWHDRALVSLVGFQFLDTRVRGWAIPFHRNFAEVNLRFYIRRFVDGDWRRGVVFLREIVAKRAVVYVANQVYHERYLRRAMRHSVEIPISPADTGRVSYAVRDAGQWLTLSATIAGEPAPLDPGSEAEFILEHYWGYTRQPDGSTQEYHVEHPSWRVWPTLAATCHGDGTGLYGSVFAGVFRHPPMSAFVAEGSEVLVREGRPVTVSRPSTSSV